WAYRYSLNGKQHWLGLGRLVDVKLAAARKARDVAAAKVAEGVDVVAERKAERRETTPSLTFSAAAAQYITAEASHWRGNGSAHQWQQSIADHAGAIAHMPVADITRQDVIATLEPIWSTTPSVARRLRSRIEAILDWCAARGHRDETLANPAAP